MAKERVDPNHHEGKKTGYELIDGVYHIAPLYTKQFDDLALQRNGVDEMLCSVTSHASKALEVIARRQKQLFEDVMDDIGIDQTTVWGYQNGTLRKKAQASNEAEKE